MEYECNDGSFERKDGAVSEETGKVSFAYKGELTTIAVGQFVEKFKEFLKKFLTYIIPYDMLIWLWKS